MHRAQPLRAETRARTVEAPAATRPVAGEESPLLAYAEVARLIERLHRRYLDVVRFELSRLKREDLNPVQALLLINIQSADLTMRDLVERGYYIGSNVTYNVRQLVAAGYIEQQRSERDRRAVKLKLTEKGQSLCAHLAKLELENARALVTRDASGSILAVRETLRALERVWTEHIQYRRE